MSNNQEETSRQSPGSDPTSSSSVVNGNKRNSGLFSFFKWFRSSSRESVNSQNSLTPNGSCESLNSTGTVASFSFVAPAAYKAQSHNQQKCLNPGPETDTYKARLKQRDKIRERDLAKNITLRKKYNLFFSRDTLFGNKNNKRNKNDETRNAEEEDEDNSKSLPLMTKKMEDGRGHRRTNSDSSKGKKSGAYLHVKGKRKAPQPPHNIPHHHHNHHQDNNSTLSLRRKKRLAPQPPPPLVTADKVENTLKNTQAPDDNIEYADVEAILTNDSLKLDHGVLKQTRHPLDPHPPKNSSIQSDLFAAPVSPKPWYKRNISKKSDNKYEPIAPAINNKKEDRKSNNIMFLTNISELDREAVEIMRKDKLRSDMKDIPEFLKPRQEQQDQQIISKRKSAKDLIAKFNAITNVTKVTVNSAFFGGGNNNANKNKEYFGPKKFDLKNNNDSSSINNNIGVADNKFVPLAKCETSACIIKPSNASTPKMERKNWLCPKCKLENDYWRIICHVCSTIKPYFDDLTTSKPKNIESAVDPRAQFKNNKEIKVLEVLETSSSAVASSSKNSQSNGSNFNGIKRLPQLERSRTQINFTHQDVKLKNKDDEREKLKKMLIEMKNSLPKRKSQCLNNAKRKSTIHEDAEIQKQTQKETQMEKEETAVENPNINVTKDLKLQEIDVKIAEKEKEVNQMKPVAMTKETDSKNFLLMRPKDFEDIYSEKTGLTKVQHHCYANTAGENLFLNVPTEKLTELKNGFKDTLEINRLLKRLETAIVKGNLNDAAIFASELAQLKVNCSVIRQKNQHVGESSHADANQNSFTVDMYVEDRLSHRGPFPLHVTQKQTVLELKQQVEREFDIPVNVQRWILGKELASSDQSNLESHNILKDGCPIFLYLVVPQKDQQKTAQNPNLEAGPSKNLTEPPKVQELSKTVLPKIVGEQLKVHIMIKPSPAPSNQQPIPINANKAVESNKAPKAVQEDFSEYEKTLKANKTWECEACTLINPNTSNMCLVCSTGRPKNASPEITRRQKKKQSKKHYYELMNLDQNDLVTNSDTFECLICLLEIAPKDGVTLRECLHQFCKICLANTIEFCDEAEVKCPYRDDQYSCDTALQDREVKALVTKNVYDQFLAKSVSQAENKIDKSFHCKTPDCTGWCIFEDNTNEFTCPVCKKTSCLTCQAIHMGLNCKQYQERMNAQSGTDEDAKRTREWLEEMVEKGEALTCPACHVILMKKWGCDWVRCTMCKTEICWVTRGLRWGPGGKGDTSGGCKCGLNGIKCHAKCNYCH